MYRVALAVMMGVACLLVAYGQFRGLPGRADDGPGLTVAIRQALASCVSNDASELCPFPFDYVSQANPLPDTAALLWAATRFVILWALA